MLFQYMYKKWISNIKNELLMVETKFLINENTGLFKINNLSSNILNSFSCIEAKEKYRGVFENQKSGDKTSSGEIGLDIRTHASR